MKKLIIYITLITSMLLPSITQAADVQVTAFIQPKVSGTLSSVTTNLSKLPADGVSSVMITVTAKYVDGTAAKNRGVAVSSNRGEVDVIDHYEGNTLKNSGTVTTDQNGIAKFTARSKGPGIATFTAIVDSVTLSNRPSVTFTPLPALSNISVTVKLPGKKTITILQPSVPEASDNSLVNTQLELQISVWYFILLILILLSSPFFFLLLLIVYWRLRTAVSKNRDDAKKEEELLAKIYALEQQVAEKQEVEMAKIDKAEAEIEEVKEKNK